MGATIGLAWSVLWASTEDSISIANAGLAAILGGVIGGRFLFVLIDWSYYHSQVLEIFQLYLGSSFIWADYRGSGRYLGQSSSPQDMHSSNTYLPSGY